MIAQSLTHTHTDTSKQTNKHSMSPIRLHVNSLRLLPGNRVDKLQAIKQDVRRRSVTPSIKLVVAQFANLHPPPLCSGLIHSLFCLASVERNGRDFCSNFDSSRSSPETKLTSARKSAAASSFLVRREKRRYIHINIYVRRVSSLNYNATQSELSSSRSIWQRIE